MPVYPGLLYWDGTARQWKCQNMLVSQDTDEALDQNEWEILVSK